MLPPAWGPQRGQREGRLTRPRDAAPAESYLGLAATCSTRGHWPVPLEHTSDQPSLRAAGKPRHVFAEEGLPRGLRRPPRGPTPRATRRRPSGPGAWTCVPRPPRRCSTRLTAVLLPMSGRRQLPGDPSLEPVSTGVARRGAWAGWPACVFPHRGTVGDLGDLNAGRHVVAGFEMGWPGRGGRIEPAAGVARRLN